jgi:hypothetical protein
MRILEILECLVAPGLVSSVVPGEEKGSKGLVGHGGE